MNKPSDFELDINGVKLTDEKPEYIHLYDKARGLQNSDQEYAFVLPVSALKQGYNGISFTAEKPGSFRVKRLEVALKYGDVETHGYF